MNTLGGDIIDWKIVGDATNFTVLGMNKYFEGDDA